MSVTPAVMRRLMRELAELQNSPPEGIRVVTSEDNMLDVTGIIEGPEGTPYAGGYFRVKFKFTEEFPAAPPKCWFATKIFHPNVSSAGEICVNTLKKDWKSSYGISHILVTVKCLLIYPNPESALDEEAGKLLLEDYNSYCDRAKLITSVHATPKTRPAEFDTPSSSDATPAPTKSTTTTTSKAPPPDSTAFVVKTLPVSPPTSTTTPLHASNTLVTSDSASSITSNKGITMSLGSENSTSNVAANAKVSVAAPKAVKRGAAPAGGEKRKKALKRL
ncbi:hypothetical protein QCA50_016092 [Cerrena zonata]|uniref:E2 ubiquitin-conjugating enzyme n=1 Tax=Cerrena zonata TaxID=2478898 RepID=A0AAW0FRC6_9APHY